MPAAAGCATSALVADASRRKLADAGAEVLKVEVRGGAPERVGDVYILSDGFRWLHSHLNRGKKSIVIDLKHPRAMEVVEPLVKWADGEPPSPSNPHATAAAHPPTRARAAALAGVHSAGHAVITNNFRSGALARMGLPYERCREWNPRIIYTANSGFGPKGEWAEKPSFDGIAQAFSGAMVHQGGGPTQGTPSLVSWAFSDEVGGLNYALSIVQALYARERTGLGQRVETSQLGATVAFQYIGLAAALHQPDHRQIDDGRSPNDRGAQWFIARCSDGKWLIVLPNTDPQWEAFTRVALERPDLFDKAPDMPSRLRVQDEM